MVKNSHIAEAICPSLHIVEGSEVIGGDENGFHYRGSSFCTETGMDCYQMTDHSLTAEAARKCQRHPRYGL